MGQKVHPVGFRLGTIRTWDSRWYADKTYAADLHEDLRIRKFLAKRLKGAQVSRIIIERAAKKAKVYVYAARPGMIIGKRCAGLDQLKNELNKITKTEVFLNIIEVRKVELDAIAPSDRHNRRHGCRRQKSGARCGRHWRAGSWPRAWPDRLRRQFR